MTMVLLEDGPRSSMSLVSHGHAVRFCSVAECVSNMLVYLRDGPASTIVRATTLSNNRSWQ